MAHIPFTRLVARIAGTSLLAGTLALASGAPSSASVSTSAKAVIGSQHVVALGSNGTVWTWGSLVPGPTGVGSKDSLAKPTQVTLTGARTAVDVAATYNASFAVASDGTVWAWGSLGRGLGDTAITTDSRYTSPVQVTFDAGVSISEISAACEGVMARASNGDVYQWGNFYGNWQMSFARPTRVSGVSGATSIERGCSTSFAVLANGTAMAWGSNGGGRLGDGTTTDRSTPVAISLPAGKSIKEISTSSSHALAIATDNTVFGWGGNANGQLAVDPNALSFSSTPRSIAIGSTTARAVAATDSTPFSTVATNANSVLKWGGWGTNEFVPTAMSLPTAELGNRTIKDIETFQGATILVANDDSLWGKGWWSTADIDGNCGANASDWPMWKDGITTPARPFVRTISQDQFGPSFNEDSLSIARLETGSGAVLPLDGSGSAVASVNNELVIMATSPRSTCYSVDQLIYEFSDDNGSTWSRNGITTSVNGFAQTVVSVSYTPTTSGRKRAQLKIVNPDGKFVVYRMAIGVAASSGGGGTVAPSALPVVAEASEVAVAIGTDKYLYAWGSAASITGSVNEVKEPVRIIPAVDSSQTFRSVVVAKRATGSFAAAAVSEDGKVYVWGNGTTDNILGGQTDISAPTQLSMPAGKLATQVMIGTSWFCAQTCATGVFGLILDSSGSVFGWGGGPDGSTGSGPRFGSSIIPLPTLAGLSFESIRPVSTYSQGVYLRQSSGDLYFWNPERVCMPTCSWRSALLLTSVSANFAPGSFQIGNSYAQGVLQISSSNSLQFVPISSDGLTVGNPVSVSLPGNRTPTRVSSSDNQFKVLAGDGTVWSVSSNRWPAWKVNVPVDALPVNRFASQNGGFIIGSGGSLWGISGSDSFASGTCSEVDYDRSSAARATSTGQFGPVFRADSFSVALDSPRFTNYNDIKSPRVVDSPTVFTWGTRQLDLRPNAATRLYTYFKSSCTGTAGLSVEWDLDDDGVFETSGTVGAVTGDTTSLTTPIVGNPNYEGDGDWLGISQSDFLESSVNITSSSPLGALNQGGGRFIAVKYTSAAGSSIERFALIVKPKKPEGRVGVTINQGARFTDNAEVTLGLVWPEGTTTAVISNDGSFSDAQQVPIASSIRWSLPSDGSGLLSSTVYVRFESLWPNYEGGWGSADEQMITNLTDDIVLDLSPPEVSSVSAASDSNAQSQSYGIARSRSTGSKALVSFSALDAVSGVSAVQITSDPAVPGPERALSSQYVVPVDRGTIAVRAKDNVGHWSRWSYARVSSFVPQPEIPAAPSAPATPSAPAAPAAPSAPATPSAPAVPAVPEVAAPAAPSVTVTPATPAAPAAATPSVSASVKLSGTSAKVSVSIPSTLAKTCATKVLKGKKTSVCTPATIVVSVSGGGSKTVKAKAGSNAITVPKAKKGATVTIKVNGKVVQKIKM
jgi:alpha-tubulin suppressor-like RCC1 family protein